MALTLVLAIPSGALAKPRVIQLPGQPDYGRSSPAAVRLYDGRVLLAAGHAGDLTTDTYDLFDPTGNGGNGSWSRHSGMNGAEWDSGPFDRSWGFALPAPGGAGAGSSGACAHCVLIISRSAAAETAGAWASQEFDPDSATWTSQASVAPSGPVTCAQAAGGTVACAGDGAIYVYDPAAHSWAGHASARDAGGEEVSLASGSLSVDRHVELVGMDSAKFMVAGLGNDHSGSAVFNAADTSIEPSGDLTSPQFDGVGVLLGGGGVLIAGGNSAAGSSAGSTQRWDPLTGIWSDSGHVTGTAALPVMQAGPMIALDASGAAHFFDGGFEVDSKFDADTGSWMSSAYKLAGVERAGPRVGAPVLLQDGRLVMFGGGNGIESPDGSGPTSVFFVADVPSPSAAPQVSASAPGATAGDHLSIAADSVWDVSGLTLGTRWQRCADEEAQTCSDIAGAAGSSYEITADDADRNAWVRAVQTYSDPIVGPVDIASSPNYVYSATGPSEAVAPVVEGSTDGFIPGDLLTVASRAEWSPAAWNRRGLEVSNRWAICDDSTGHGCDANSDASYSVTREDIFNQRWIRYESVATDPKGRTATSVSRWIQIRAPEGPNLKQGSLEYSYPRSDLGADPRAGQTITASQSEDFEWTVSPTTIDSYWERYDTAARAWIRITGSSEAVDTTGIKPGVYLRSVAVAHRLDRAAQDREGEPVVGDAVRLSTDLWSPNASWSIQSGSNCGDPAVFDGIQPEFRPGCLVWVDSNRLFADGTDYGSSIGSGWATWIGAPGEVEQSVTPEGLVSQATEDATRSVRYSGGTAGSGSTELGVEVFFRASQAVDAIAKVVKLTNLTGAPVTRSLSESVQLATGGATAIRATSSGRSSLAAGDRWVVTSGFDDSDAADAAVATSVFGGSGAASSPQMLQEDPSCSADDYAENGDFNCHYSDRIGARFTVTVPAGESRYLLFISGVGGIRAAQVGGSASNDWSAAASNAAALFGSPATIPADLLVDIPKADRMKVVNWQFNPPLELRNIGWSTVSSGTAKFLAQGAAGSQLEISNYSDFRSPVTVNVGRWGSIKTLAKGLDAGQVTLYYREKGKPAPSASTVVKYDFYTPFISKRTVHWAKSAKGIWNLHLIARDKTCPGCDETLKVQIAYGTSRPSDAAPFPTRLLRDLFDYKVDTVIKAPTPPRWVRVSDSQGNVSKWNALAGMPAYPRP